MSRMQVCNAMTLTLELRTFEPMNLLPTVMAGRSQLVQFIQSLSDNIIELRGIRGRRSEVGNQRSEGGGQRSGIGVHEL